MKGCKPVVPSISVRQRAAWADLPPRIRLGRRRPARESLLSRFIPTTIREAGLPACRAFSDFFEAQIRNPNTRAAYANAVERFFGWCEVKRICLPDIQAGHVANYIDAATGRGPEFRPGLANRVRRAGITVPGPRTLSAPTVKQHLAALRMLFNWFVIKQITPSNPAWHVRGPKHVVRTGKTTVVSVEQVRTLLDSIPVRRCSGNGPTHDLVGLRDRALIASMFFSFARVGAVVGMRVTDYQKTGDGAVFRLLEKGGRVHVVPAHPRAQLFLGDYLEAAEMAGRPESPLFPSITGQGNRLRETAMSRIDVFRMIKRRARVAGLPGTVNCHTFRAAGITAFRDAGGTLEMAQRIAGHASPMTTTLYDRSRTEIAVSEIERIRI